MEHADIADVADDSDHDTVGFYFQLEMDISHRMSQSIRIRSALHNLLSHSTVKLGSISLNFWKHGPSKFPEIYQYRSWLEGVLLK